MKPKLSILTPSIRKDRILGMYTSLLQSCKKHSFELVIVGPYYPDMLTDRNVKYIRDFGSPARAVQIAANFAEGELLTLVTDDAYCYENTIDQCIDDLDTDIMLMRYTEDGQYRSKDYWLPSYHDATKTLKGLPENSFSVTVPLMKRSLFEVYGGLDTQTFEMANMSVQDLCFRCQKVGKTVKLSPCDVFNVNWMPGTTGDHAPVHYAETDNDGPAFTKIWEENNQRLYVTGMSNWKASPNVWQRRFSS